MPWGTQDGRLSHTVAATLGLVMLAAGMGAMLVAIADKIALAIWVAQLQALDLGFWLPLPEAGTPAAGECLVLITAVATRRCDRPRSQRRRS